MLIRKPFLMICLLGLSFLIVPSSLHAEKAAIRDLLITTDKTNLLLYARVTDCFNGDIEDAILAGVPTTFTFMINLYAERSWFPDKKLKSMKVQHTIKYDNIKKNFNVSVDNQKTWENFSDFDSAKRMMADINALPLEDIHALKKNAHYSVQLKAKLEQIRLPLHLEYLFFFVSILDFETGWRQERFVF